MVVCLLIMDFILKSIFFKSSSQGGKTPNPINSCQEPSPLFYLPANLGNLTRAYVKVEEMLPAKTALYMAFHTAVLWCWCPWPFAEHPVLHVHVHGDHDCLAIWYKGLTAPSPSDYWQLQDGDETNMSIVRIGQTFHTGSRFYWCLSNPAK